MTAAGTDPGIIVIGGGLAGITAALDCAAAGGEVTLLEYRGRLGGAAYSFERDGLRADNGQHVFLRCCTDYQRLLSELGASGLTTIQPRLDIAVLSPSGPAGRLRRSGLPAPLHLFGALARYPHLDRRDRLAVTVAMARLRFVDPDDPRNDRVSFGSWLRRWRQDPRSVEAIWDLIVRPTVNLRCDDASLAQAALVFRLGLLERADAGDVGHAVAPLSEIHDVAARSALARAGVDVRLRTTAVSLTATDDGFEVGLAGGGTLVAGQVIVATPPARAAELVPAAACVDRAAWTRLGSSPIVNLHVVYDRPVLDRPFAAAVDSPVQWIFDRTDSSGLTGGGQYLAVTLSAADEELGMSSEALRDRYLPALRELLPAARDAQVQRFFVTRDHSATFRAAPGQRELRPGPATALPGLALAGAWTDTGWPATMEGAVRSGHAAAAAVTERLRRGGTAANNATAAPRAAPKKTVAVLAPMRLEAHALRSVASWAELRTTGIGHRRAAAYVASADHSDAAAVVIAGFCGALGRTLRPGDIVLGTELRGVGGTESAIPCADPTILAGVLRRAGLHVSTGPIVSTPKLATGAARAVLRQTGAVAADMESFWLAPAAAAGRPLVVMRVVLDTPDRELRDPVASARGTAAAYRSLRTAAAALPEWASMLSDRQLVLGSPRASCAGVRRAVEIVERAIERYGAPLYVRRQIVHNAHVVDSLRHRGAVFVEEVEEVPEGATVVFSAHGVSPAVRRQAQARHLNVIDATCPLVAKVHAEARRFAASGFDIVLVGHEGHEEIHGTFGEAPERTTVIGSVDQVASLEVSDPAHVAYLTQTTLAVDETAAVVDALRDRFPDAVAPPTGDICYATQNRQTAVRALAESCDVILVVGSENSSNSRRLVEVAHRAGRRALLVTHPSEIAAAAIAGARRIGITAGASAPEQLVSELVAALRGLGAASVTEQRVADETLQFKLPPEVR